MIDFHMPSLGADMEKDIVVEWLKKPGDAIVRGDVLRRSRPRKRAFEIEVFDAGTLKEILVAVGTEARSAPSWRGSQAARRRPLPPERRRRPRRLPFDRRRRRSSRCREKPLERACAFRLPPRGAPSSLASMRADCVAADRRAPSRSPMSLTRCAAWIW